jgi:glycosyltransferase involved in cell wall biosynthesis
MNAGAVERCAVLIPARDEAERIGAVVAAASAAGCGPVLVVDDGSRDGTARAASAAGARVLALPRNVGKGGALAAGAAELGSEVVVLLDADLTGLRAEHVRALAEPVLRGEAAMTRGVFRGARWTTTTAQRLAPQLGGQRALRRADLLALPGLSGSRFGVEILLTDAARRHGWTWIDVPLDGVGQVMKEEKRGWWAGVRARAAMYRDIAVSWWRARR